MSHNKRKQFGQHIRELRLRREMTQESLAERAKMHPTYVGGIERGERNIGFDNIIKLAEALDVTPVQLFTGVIEDG